jgi:hypothetical protein
MALALVQHTVHRTLGILAVDQLTFEIPCSVYRIINRDPVTSLYVRFDGVDPSVLGNDAFLVLPNSEKLFTPNPPSSEARIISALGIAYSVECVF